MSIPTPESVDHSFLTGLLREAGHRGAEVRSFDASRIGTGQIGLCIRYAMEVDGDPSAPRSLVGKFPSLNETSRQTGVALKNYLKEVMFYRELSDRVSIRLPRCYYAEIDGQGPEFALFLEDMAPARQGDQLGGCDPSTAHAAVLELVGLHAPTWNAAGLRGHDWLGEADDDSIAMVRGLYQSVLDAFCARFGPALAADELAILRKVGECEGPLFEPLREPYCVVHGDYRLDNLLIDARSEPPGISVVDWQVTTLAPPMNDVAYFLGAGLMPEARRRTEEGIVRDYHQRLCAAGVAGYGWEDCWRDYRRGVFAGFAVTVIAAMVVEETERGNEMFTAMASRHARHALDLGSEEFLG